MKMQKNEGALNGTDRVLQRKSILRFAEALWSRAQNHPGVRSKEHSGALQIGGFTPTGSGRLYWLLSCTEYSLLP